MGTLRVSLVTLLLTSFLPFAHAQQPTKEKSEPALDVTSMDRSVDPCADFFAYSCGGWLKKNPIPPDQSSWNTYSKMQDENLGRLRAILEAASAPDQKRNPVDQKIGDYYASCTDEKAMNVYRQGAIKLVNSLSRFEVRPAESEGWGKAEVTVGGIDTSGLSSKTMEAREVMGLYAIGEAVDVTGWLGGYNFQWAWSSGWCAGNAI